MVTSEAINSLNLIYEKLIDNQSKDIFDLRVRYLIYRDDDDLRDSIAKLGGVADSTNRTY